MKIPTWRPDITQPIDIVEEIVRIKGYNNIKTLEPEKTRIKDTLNKKQKLFHFLQRSVASKGYYETVTWSFTDSKINQLFIARDRFGKKPLYYHINDRKEFTFASELTALTVDDTIPKKVSFEALNCYLAIGYMLFLFFKG